MRDYNPKTEGAGSPLLLRLYLFFIRFMQKLLPLILLFALGNALYAQDNSDRQPDKGVSDSTLINIQTTTTDYTAKVLGKKKRVERPERIDRGIMQTVFIPKGQWMAGGTVSYSEHEEDNLNFLVIKNVQGLGYTFNVSPYVGYFFKDNMAAGLRIRLLAYLHAHRQEQNFRPLQRSAPDVCLRSW